jgi:hypothetical protein
MQLLLEQGSRGLFWPGRALLHSGVGKEDQHMDEKSPAWPEGSQRVLKWAHRACERESTEKKEKGEAASAHWRTASPPLCDQA